MINQNHKEQKITYETSCNNEAIYCSMDGDLTLDGKYENTKIIITENYLCIKDLKKETISVPIIQCSNFKIVVMFGSGFLKCTIAQEEKFLIRFTLSKIEEFSKFARFLNSLSENRPSVAPTFTGIHYCSNCGRALPDRTKVCLVCLNKNTLFFRLLSFMKPLWKIFLLAAILFWSLTALRIYTPHLYRLLVDNHLTSNNFNHFEMSLLLIGIFLSFFGSYILGSTRNFILSKAGSHLARDLRSTIFTQLQQLSISYITPERSGDLLNRVTRDTRRIQEFIQSRAALGLNEILTLFILSIVLFFMNWKLALLIVVPVPFVISICIGIRKIIRRMYRQQNECFDKANTLLQEIFSGIREIKAFGQEKRVIEKFRTISSRLAAITSRNEQSWNTLFPLLGYIMGLGNFFVLYFGAELVLHEKLKLGELILYTQYASMMYGPLNWISFFPRWLEEALVSAARYFEVVDEIAEIPHTARELDITLKGNITFNNVTFGYKPYDPVVSNINIDIRSGAIIGLVGHSGAGKSTIANLLLRFYDVNHGEILLDNINLKDIPQSKLRESIGVVLQETFLFSGTILQNIRYTKQNATLEQVIQASKIAQAHNFIMRLPDAYDTRIGEKGHKLSGGERQRLALARTVLHDPAILILDEATSSIDTETERAIQESLKHLTKNRTTIAIAHRLSTLRNANCLYVLDKGKVIETGSHSELMRKRGKYFNLIMAQHRLSSGAFAKENNPSN